jgi:LuxR family transcriptional activator of bioluminescence operon
MKLYQEEQRHKIDPVISYIMSKNVPVRWDQLMKREGFDSVEQKSFMLDAMQYGLINGVSIPLRSVSGEMGIFSLATDRVNESENILLTKILPYAHTFSVYLFDRYLRFLYKEQSINKFELTKREHECLFWACEGKTSWEISKILEISERTILFHLNNTTSKLKATNRQHSVAIAIKSGLIQPNL